MSRIRHWWKCARNNFWLWMQGYCFKHERMPEDIRNDQNWFLGHACRVCWDADRDKRRRAKEDAEMQAKWTLEKALATRRLCKR